MKNIVVKARWPLGMRRAAQGKPGKKHFAQEFILMLLINVDHESIILIVVDVL